MKKKKKEIETKYQLDLKMYKEFSRGYMFSNETSNILLMIIVFLLYVNLFAKNYGFAMVYSILLMLIAVLPLFIKGKLQYHRTLESNGGNEPHYKYIFKEDEMIAINEDNSNQNQYQYDQVIAIVETDNLFILKLKYRLGIIVNKNHLDGGTREDFVDFIFQKCTNIKEKKVISAKRGMYIRFTCFLLSFLCLICAIILKI